MRLKKDDNVIILAGKDKGKKGKILRVLPKKNKIIVEKVNIVKKHRRPKRAGEKGTLIEITAPINVSKAMLICSKCLKPTRIGLKISADYKIRICKKCQAEI